MARSTTLTIKILADASQASREMDKAGGGVSKFQRGVEKAAIPAAAIGAGLLLFAKAAGKAASDAEQAAGAVDAVFGSTAKTIHRFAKTSADSVGLASSEYETMATVFGSQLKNMGVSADQLAPKTNDLVKLGADLAAQYGGTTADAVSALSALLRGETDPIERYGVSIKQADIAAEQAKHGMTGLTGAAAKQAKMTATLTLLTKQTASAHGAFAREADTAAHKQQVANAKWLDAKAAIGKALLPAMVLLAGVLARIAGLMSKNSTATTIVLAAVAALVVVILALNAAYKVQAAAAVIAGAANKAFGKSTKLAAVGQWLLNAAMAANPAVLITIAVIALVAAVVLLYKKSATFRRIVSAAFGAVLAAAQAVAGWIKKYWPLLFVILTGPFGLAVAVIAKHWTAIKDAAAAVFDWLRDHVGPAFAKIGKAATRYIAPIVAVFDRINDAIHVVIDAVAALIDKISHIKIPKLPKLPHLPNPFSAAPPVAGPAPAARSAAATSRVGSSSGAAGGIVINVNGALDPEAVARQIRGILGRHNVRMGTAGRTGAPA